MSRKKPYKHGKRGGQPFVQLHLWVMKSDAWRSLTPTARALYVELKSRYNGSNNGNVRLSHREAAEALNTHRNTVRRYFTELHEKGFIEMMEGPHLGPSGIGQTAKWLLTEYPGADLKPARKTFMGYGKEQKPRTKSVQARHKKQDGSGASSIHTAGTGTNSVTPKAENPPDPRTENRTIIHLTTGRGF